MSKRVGVILSGCGFLDGTEIHEAVVTLLALDRAGAEVRILAPNKSQMDVVNHKSGQKTGEVRNVLTESSRIARGNIEDIAEAKAEDLDAVILPGGYGAAKNLTDFAVKGSGCTIHPEVERLLKEMFDAKKPIGAECIAPTVVARALMDRNVKIKLTIGNDKETAAALEALGAKHIQCTVDEVVADEKNKVVSTPAYMLGPGIKDIATGIEKLVDQVLAWA